MRHRLGTIALAGLILAIAGAAPAGGAGAPVRPGGGAAERPPILREVGIDQRLGEPVPPDLRFRDESGQSVRLGDYFGDRPIILTLNYYECPMLCTMVLDSLVRALRPLRLEPGRDFRIVTVSINPVETPELAAAKKAVYVGEYARAGADSAWHFLTGEEASIRALAGVVGFRYAFDESTRQYAHAAGILVLTPDGHVSRYLYGVDYAPRDLKLALVESAAGRIGTLADQVLLFCYHYDPATGRYGLAALTSMRIGGVLTLLILAGAVVLLRLRESRRRGLPRESHRAV